MQDKKEMAKLILAGVLLTASLPSNTQAENFSGNATYLAVAGCASCGGKPGHSVNSDGEVADAGNEMSKSSDATPKSHPLTHPNQHNHSNSAHAGRLPQNDAASQ